MTGFRPSDSSRPVVVSLREKCRHWLNDAIYCYGARGLPRNRQIECILGGEHRLRKEGPNLARDYIFTVVERWADTKGRAAVNWQLAVKSMTQE